MYHIHHQFTIHSGAEKIFRSISLPEELNNWWPKTSVGKPEVGEQYQLYFGPEYDWLAEITSVKENEHITWKMIRSMDDWMPTHFGFQLIPQIDRTIVKFFHKNWQEANDHFAVSSYCWAILLNGLKNYCEHGIVIPFENRN